MKSRIETPFVLSFLVFRFEVIVRIMNMCIHVKFMTTHGSVGLNRKFKYFKPKN